MIPLANADDYVKALPDRKLVVLLGLGHLPQEEAPKTSLVPVKEFLAANRSKISPKTRGPRNNGIVGSLRRTIPAGHFPFAFNPASRASRSALRRLWFSSNSGAD